METISQVIIPTVTETSARGERIFDIYSLLLRERIVFLGTPINDQIANLIIAQLLYLEREPLYSLPWRHYQRWLSHLRYYADSSLPYIHHLCWFSS
jgi:hypothetical protein